MMAKIIGGLLAKAAAQPTKAAADLLLRLDAAETLDGRPAQRLAPILDHKDQMNDKPRNAVPASPKRWLRHCTPSLVWWLV